VCVKIDSSLTTCFHSSRMNNNNLCCIYTLNSVYADATPQALISWAHQKYARLVMTSSFGVNSAAFLHLVQSVARVPVIMVDTGYLFPETYEYCSELQELLDLDLRVAASPTKPELFEAWYGSLWEQGQDGRDAYHAMRKEFPLHDMLLRTQATACLNGIRSCSNANRATLSRIMPWRYDVARIHPVFHWTDEQVAEYMRIHSLPQHPLYAQGYESVGDKHTTVPGKGRTGRILGERSECGINLQ